MVGILLCVHGVNSWAEEIWVSSEYRSVVDGSMSNKIVWVFEPLAEGEGGTIIKVRDRESRVEAWDVLEFVGSKIKRIKIRKNI